MTNKKATITLADRTKSIGRNYRVVGATNYIGHKIGDVLKEEEVKKLIEDTPVHVIIRAIRQADFRI